jgi:hypothetical protein
MLDPLVTGSLAQTSADYELTSKLIEVIADHGFWIIGGGVAVVAIVCGAVTSMVSTRARERSRREIAAYIAEGSMTPEQGERLIAAAPKDD